MQKFPEVNVLCPVCKNYGRINVVHQQNSAHIGHTSMRFLLLLRVAISLDKFSDAELLSAFIANPLSLS